MVSAQLVGRTILSVITTTDWTDTIVCPTWALVAQQAVEPVLERLDPQRRIAVIMAIIWIVVIGLILVTCTMLGARWVRRLARHTPRPSRLDSATQAAADNSGLRSALEGMLPPVDPNETIHIDRKRSDTKHDP